MQSVCRGDLHVDETSVWLALKSFAIESEVMRGEKKCYGRNDNSLYNVASSFREKKWVSGIAGFRSRISALFPGSTLQPEEEGSVRIKHGPGGCNVRRMMQMRGELSNFRTEDMLWIMHGIIGALNYFVPCF